MTDTPADGEEQLADPYQKQSMEQIRKIRWGELEDLGLVKLGGPLSEHGAGMTLTVTEHGVELHD